MVGRRGSERIPVWCGRRSNPVPMTWFTTCGTTSVSTAVERSKTRASSTNTRSKTSRRRVRKSIVIDGIIRVARAVARCLNRPLRPRSPTPTSGRAPGEEVYSLFEPLDAKPPYARLKLATPDAPHDFTEPERKAAYEWLDGLLK